jgi:hypothetical protein
MQVFATIVSVALLAYLIHGARELDREMRNMDAQIAALQQAIVFGQAGEWKWSALRNPDGSESVLHVWRVEQ